MNFKLMKIFKWCIQIGWDWWPVWWCHYTLLYILMSGPPCLLASIQSTCPRPSGTSTWDDWKEWECFSLVASVQQIYNKSSTQNAPNYKISQFPHNLFWMPYIPPILGRVLVWPMIRYVLPFSNFRRSLQKGWAKNDLIFPSTFVSEPKNKHRQKIKPVQWTSHNPDSWFTD